MFFKEKTKFLNLKKYNQTQSIRKKSKKKKKESSAGARLSFFGVHVPEKCTTEPQKFCLLATFKKKTR
jgi:hypothetical protein